MLRLDSIVGNSQQLDGGAMFGNCPRSLWSRWCPPDDSNRIALDCRALLVREESGRAILFEAGVGAFFEPSMRERYGVQEAEHILLRSLGEVGVEPEAIDVIVLSHLHFDHAGGILEPWREGQGLKLAFPNAHYVVGEKAFERAKHPHARDRASFIVELPALLESTGRLERVTGSASETLGEGYNVHYADGHTPGLMMARIETGDPGPINFVSDLIPGVPWIHAPITMGYDRFPELLIDEKLKTLERVMIGNEWLFLTHDPQTALCQVECDERGRYSAIDEHPQLRSST